MKIDDGYIGLQYENETIVSLITFECASNADLEIDTDLEELIILSAPLEGKTRPPIDGVTYLSLLMSVADADGKIDKQEENYIKYQANIFGVSLNDIHKQDLESLNYGEIAPETISAVMRDLLFLANIDGDYDTKEKQVIRKIADDFGIDEERLTKLEADIITILPKALKSQPSWFQEAWFMGSKTF